MKNLLKKRQIVRCVVVIVFFLVHSKYLFSQSYRGFGLNQDGLWELIDENGNVIGADKYKEVNEFFNSVALVNLNGRNRYIDKNGKVLTNGTTISDDNQWISFRNFNEGYACVRYLDDFSWTWIDSTGRIITDKRYRYIGDFSGGLAFAREYLNSKYGYIDTSGNWVIEPKFKLPFTFIGDLATAEYKGKGYSIKWKRHFVKRTGEVIKLPNRIIPYFYKDVSYLNGYNVGSYARTRKMNLDDSSDLLWPIVKKTPFTRQKGYINRNGDIVVPCKYKYAGEFYEGRAFVRYWGKRHFMMINTKGEIVSDKIFSSCEDFHDGISLVIYNGKKVFIDVKGNIIDISSNIILNGNFSNGFAIVKVPKLGYNFINTEGEIISDKYFYGARKFGEGLAAVLINSKWGFINTDGKIVIEPRYLRVMDFKQVY